MTEPLRDHEALFVAHLPFVERAAAAIGRVMGFKGADAEEFVALARERIWQHDYAVLRKWRGESQLTTYLTTVLTNLGREFRVQRWGRWRPSAAAQRLGPVAVRLETLVYRDGHALAEAAVLLRQRGETTLTDRALAQLLAEIPSRARPRRTDDGETALETVAAPSGADDVVLAGEEDAERGAAYVALDGAIGRLPSEEQLVIRMHFLRGHTLADVARVLGVPQRPLYRVKDRALAALGAQLQAAGVTPAVVQRLLGGALASSASPDATDARDGNPAVARPSTLTRRSDLPDADDATTSSAHARGGQP